ncbi:MAG TPA: tetratricopeptide repeat protein, partial [Methanospirillum sp.]|uniref:tetratricopeptide repeat protein n=1 Tax=Methanospirillum sp. TaxID=45200 RepID=UPI002C5A394D
SALWLVGQVWADTNTSLKTAQDHYSMGNAFYSYGIAENATREYQIAVSMDPNFSDAWNNLGLSLTAQKRYSEAKDALENATRLNSTDPEGWYNLGYTLGMLGNKSEEVAAYERAISIRPNMTIAWRNIGVVRYEEQNYTGAAEAFEKATKYDPNSALGWYYLGTVYEKTGNLTGAADVLKRAVDMDKNLTMAKDRLKAVEKNLSNSSSGSSSIPSQASGKKSPLPAAVVILSLVVAAIVMIFRR